MRVRHVPRSLAPLLVLSVLTVLGVAGAASAAEVPPAVSSALDAYTRASMSVADAVKPSVVFIEVTERADLTPTQTIPGAPGGSPGGARAEASGVIISPTGDVLTNAHVVDGATKIMVSLPSGQSYPATVVGVDKIRDVAVIRVRAPHPLPAATLGNADNTPAGAWVMAVGFPFGAELDPALRYDPSVSTGVVSAVHRDVETDSGSPALTDLIQTDAAINPGNSGGPLVNSRGEVIGINEGIFTTGEAAGNIGVGFAIPIDARTRQIVRTLQSGRSVVRGQLGVAVVPLTPERKQQTGAQYGAFVREVKPDGPAARAGVRAGDVIIGYGGQRVNSTDDLIGMIYTTPPGTSASIQVLRNRQQVALDATVAQLTLTAERTQVSHGTI